MVVVLGLMYLGVLLQGCSQLSGPSDSEVITAIKKVPNMTITSPITIKGRGNKQPNGAYPVTVSFTYIMSPLISGGGDMTYHLYKKQDEKGKVVWYAQ